MMSGLVTVAASIPGCFPDPPADDGLLDSGIFISADGTVITPIPDGATSGLSLSSNTIDFGLSECGGVAPKNQTLTLTNTSTGPITYGIAVSGDQFSLAGAGDGGASATTSGTIPPGQSANVTLAASGVSAFATAGGLVEGALQVVTDAPGQKLFVVDLKVTAQGAQLTMIPGTANFGLVTGGTQANLNVGFRNNGNAPVSVIFDEVPFFPLTLQSDDDAGAGFTVNPSSTTMLAATYQSDGESSPSQDIGFHTVGVVCGGNPPSSITLMGQASSTGSVSITPGIVTFDVGGTGFVPCGQASTPRSFTVANSTASGTPDLFITSVKVTSGAFAVTPGVDTSDGSAGITLTQGNSQVFTVTPSAVNAPAPTSPNALQGTVDISYSGVASGTFTVQLSQTAQGAVLAFDPSSIAFGNAPLDFPTMQLLGVTNSGNAAVGLTLAVTGSPYFTVSPSSSFSVNTPGGSSTVSFLPVATGASNGTISLTPSGSVCSSPPPGVVLTGNGALDAGAPDAG